MPIYSEQAPDEKPSLDLDEAYLSANWEQLLALPQSPPDSTCDSPRLQNCLDDAPSFTPQKRPNAASVDCLFTENSAGLRFEAFMTPSNLGRKKDDLLHSLVRVMGKLAKFCRKADNTGFDAAFRMLVSDHKELIKRDGETDGDTDGEKRNRRGRYVPVRARLETSGRYLKLFQGYLSMYDTKTQRNTFCKSFVNKLPKRKFTKALQRALFEEKPTRIFFYLTVQFLDDSSDSASLSSALSVHCNPCSLREQLVYSYMNYLDLPPFDGLSFGNTFSLCKHLS